MKMKKMKDEISEMNDEKKAVKWQDWGKSETENFLMCARFLSFMVG